MSDKQDDLVLTGAALRAAVSAAETPVLVDVVKTIFLKQLALDEMLQVDLRDHPDLAPANPVHPPRPSRSTPQEDA